MRAWTYSDNMTAIERIEARCEEAKRNISQGKRPAPEGAQFIGNTTRSRHSGKSKGKNK